MPMALDKALSSMSLDAFREINRAQAAAAP
jgi:hypothetical protein